MGTLTINTTAPQDVRLIAAVKREQNMSVDPTGAQVKTRIIDLVRSFVQSQEVAAAAPFIPTSFDPS